MLHRVVSAAMLSCVVLLTAFIEPITVILDRPLSLQNILGLKLCENLNTPNEEYAPNIYITGL